MSGLIPTEITHLFNGLKQMVKEGSNQMEGNTVISWSIDGIFKANAEKVYEEIGGDTKITPADVLEKARDEKTELHKCFEWDDSIAGEKYRLMQARQVVQMIVVKPVEKKSDAPKVRMFQITQERNVYQPTVMFLQNKDEYSDLLARAKRELQAFKERYKQLSELEEIFKSIDML